MRLVTSARQSDGRSQNTSDRAISAARAADESPRRQLCSLVLPRCHLHPELASHMFDEVGASLDSSALSENSAKSGGDAGIPKGALLAAGAVAVMIVAFLVLNSGSESAPIDPDDAASITHEVGIASMTSTIVIQWSEVEADGFSVVWDLDLDTLPDEIVDEPGSTTETVSPRLDTGSWFFHLRTLRGDAWTSTVHLGPFVITESATTTTTTTITLSTTTTSTTGIAEPPDVTGTFTYETAFDPSGDCGYPAFTDAVTIALNEDGTATLAQAQHISTGTWAYDPQDGLLTLDLVLDSEFPETYLLTSSDQGATLSGQSTYEDGAGCVTTYDVTARR